MLAQMRYKQAVRLSQVLTSDYMTTTVSISHNAVASSSFATQLITDLVSSDASIAAVYRRRLPAHSQHLSHDNSLTSNLTHFQDESL